MSHATINIDIPAFIPSEKNTNIATIKRIIAAKLKSQEASPMINVKINCISVNTSIKGDKNTLNKNFNNFITNSSQFHIYIYILLFEIIIRKDVKKFGAIV